MILVYWKVFSSFASAAIRIRASGIRKYLKLRSDKDIDGNISQYKFGMVLKETMLSLGPTFIKGKEYFLIEVLISIGPSALYLFFSPNYCFCFQYCSINYMLGPYFFSCSHKITNMLVTCLSLLMQLVSPFPQGQILLVLRFPRSVWRDFSLLPFIGVVSGCTCGNEET